MDGLLKKRFDISRLLAKLLAGELGEEERRQLDAWLNASPRHREELEALRAEMSTGKGALDLQREGHRELDKHWRDFKKRARRRRSIFSQEWWRYAALFLVPLGLALYFWMEREVTVQLAELPVVPGAFKARLTLDDGVQVELDSASRLVSDKVSGMEVKAENSVLTYKSGEDLLSPVEEVKYNTLAIPRGGEYALVLADGTKVWLNSKTTLKFPVRFSGKERRVEMTGEGYFEVAKDNLHPFIVSVDGVEVKVLGTSFNVSAYEGKVVTTLVEGRVRVSTGKDSVELTPDQQAAWNGRHLEVCKVDARNYALWREGVFFFKDTRLEDILNALARWYDVSVFFQNPALKDMCFSMEIKRYEDIETILRRMSQTNRVRFDVKNRTVNVYE